MAHEDHFWRALCDLTGLDADRDLGSQARFADHARLRGELQQALIRQPLAEWERMFTKADVPFGRLRSLEELPETPQSKARGTFSTVDSASGTGVHLRQTLVVDGNGPGPRRGSPALGEHTVDVLAGARLDDDAISVLFRATR